MKRLQLPKNKFLRLSINIAFIPIWYQINLYLIFSIYNSIVYSIFDAKYFEAGSIVQVLYNIPLIAILVIPIAILTKTLWFPTRPKITSSKD